jgi:hypothetical protein
VKTRPPEKIKKSAPTVESVREAMAAARTELLAAAAEEVAAARDLAAKILSGEPSPEAVFRVLRALFTVEEGPEREEAARDLEAAPAVAREVFEVESPTASMVFGVYDVVLSLQVEYQDEAIADFKKCVAIARTVATSPEDVVEAAVGLYTFYFADGADDEEAA